MTRRLRHLCGLSILALVLGLSPAAAQDAPPLPDEGPRPSPARPAPPKDPAKSVGQAAKPTQPPGSAKPAHPAPPHTGPAVKNDGKRYLRSLDENHDGRVTRQEFLARAREKFAELDLNHDGVLSPSELGKAREHARKKRDEARRRTGKPPAQHDPARTQKPPLTDRDLDGDGRVTLKEYLARREQKFAELDVNRDGVISREEAKAEKRRILSRRAEIKAEKRAVAARQAERQAARDEKAAARKRREDRRLEIQTEREAKAQRRVARMTKKAEGEWSLPPEAEALGPGAGNGAEVP